MRIRKLGLRRYGKFTDEVIDFGERSAGAPDLHIVYGPNEAGKSTAMSACMDLFYGIHHQSRFNFLHPYPTMRIEAELEIFGTVRGFSRIKLPHNSLLDDAGNTVAEAMLLGELGGLDRNAYQTMFCLDDETLEDGVVEDPSRVAYLSEHLDAVRRSITAGVDIRRYHAWSLLDNFEWEHGYAKRFGIVRVDYATQQRTLKASALWYRDTIRRVRSV